MTDENVTTSSSDATTAASAAASATDSGATAKPVPSPADDLYRHVNGAWIDSHVIPADRAVDGAFHKLREESEKAVRAIVEDAPADSRIGVLYGGFMDEAAIEAAGIDALAPDIAAIDVDDRDDLAEALGALDRIGVTGPAAFWVEKDSSSDEAMLYLVQAGLGLPDEAYYREEAHAETLAAYRGHVESMLQLLEDSTVCAGDFEGFDGLDSFPLHDLPDAARRIVDFEMTLAEGHWDVVASRDAVRTYNLTALTDLPAGFPWARWFAQMGVGAEAGGQEAADIDRIVVMQPTYLEHLARVWRDADLDDLRLWALWRVLKARAPYLGAAFVEQNFEFYGKTLSGAEELRARWKRGVGLVEGALGQEVGKEYVARHFPPEHKERMLELVDYLLEAYRERITDLEWMTSATRERALEKLGLFKAKIGYPDKWRSYEGLELTGSLLDDVRRASAFGHDYEVAKLGKPADRDEWFATPQTVNAFYNPVVNDITFPAAILQPPFFDPDADAAANFGAIGAVIGHEIGHGFDDQGSQYDGHGNLNQWWTDADRAAFEGLTDKLVEQFDGLVPTGLRELGETGVGVNGKFTLGENIGDLGGLGIAVVAYRRWLADQGRETSVEKDPAAYRGLFLSWALVWRTAIRPEMSRQYLAIDPHSPAEFRCNVIVGDIDEFHVAFDVQPGDGMWRDPAERVTIW
ncbi:M13 family metallopeptidase [Corynebacterium freneyi]|uniref:Endopeptidase n=1 Tax=Corynebacterium freneyi TaxID=134034 RepID=A0ABS4UB82_9CORY|nr:M13-type metalloendopeptidase [Corynebacterium freneyi]MBP2333817.1 putative endopeptidase [Corynebacterium freneyi]QXA52201.1 peptidase M13 [Corynebacterium freneyi]WJZ04081.1 Neutral endopeptidase [Corynebacterium freneyi]